MSQRHLPHLIIAGFFETNKYTAAPRGGGGTFSLPARDRVAHGTSIREQLQTAKGENDQNRSVGADQSQSAPIIIEVRSEPGFLLKLESLEEKRRGIEVACVRHDGDVQIATIHIPEGALTHFLKRADEYLNENTKGGGKTQPRPKHEDFVATISQIRLATLHSFWTEEQSDFPAPESKVWWEVWVRIVGGQNIWESFRLIAQSQPVGLTVGNETIEFPDRVVGLIHGTAEQIMVSAELLDMIGELRLAKENPADFIALEPRDQADWVKDLVSRITPPPAGSPAVCILDGGIVANPLIQPALNPSDCHTYDPAWPIADSEGWPTAQRTHGTEMAGVVLFGRHLASALAGHEPHVMTHCLESVRILPPKPYQNERRLFGAITSQSVSRVEIASPDRVRSFCLALSTDGRDRGRPSSWSGVIDQICAGISDQNPRLFFIAAGNTEPEGRHQYPESNDTDPIRDPAQAWNAITVGAYTDRVMFDQSKFPGFAPTAQAGDISPSSTTSLIWESQWPYKPDIVLEGGNEVISADGRRSTDPDDMSMLTTAHATSGRLLVPFAETSAATAQAVQIAAILQGEYPGLWPETIRALLINSAEWTDRMKAAFGNKKWDLINRLRRYGYGVPSLDRARYSARDSLTMIVEQTIQPFIKEGSDIKTKEMGLHTLPWPKDHLLELGDLKVKMRVTLSYFIEPKPGRREGFAKYRHRYQSHGLRFEVKRPQEPLEGRNGFKQRISQAARSEQEEHDPVGDTSGWELGPKARTRGSIHCDWWTGTAADLANCGVIAVYPVSGWWRESRGNHWSKEARYSLIVSIQAEEVSVAVSLFGPTEVDFYTPVKASIIAAIEQPAVIEVENQSE